ncbi:MAG TPA: ATP-binding protein [Kofleriaceae bacterium]|nr:ATP-binding protein [Kofleriaceae bacterium]
MVSRRFAALLLVRVAVLLALLVALAFSITRGDLRAVPLVLGGLALLQVGAILRFVGRANRELARFVGAIRHDDVTQTFALGRLGPTFADVGRVFEEALARFRERRRADEERLRYLEALVEHVPVALLSVRDDGRVELLNSAARRLLNASTRSSVAALDAYGPAFQRDVAQSRAGGRTLTRTSLDGVDRHLVLSTTQIALADHSERITSLQDIQSELDEGELAAWQDMLRVLSHEILNSLTPISSLARTADEIVRDLAQREAARPHGIDPDGIADLRDAVQTLSRRSDGLLRFVTSYRRLTHLPPPALHPLPLRDYFRRLETLVGSAWASRGIALRVREPPEGLELVADESLLDQAVINILQNAADAAAAASDEPQVWLSSSVSERGRPIVEIADNGPGFSDDIKDKIFLPFFTTKPDGSGIGLALARQIMLIHRGAITATARAGGGALFRLTF